MRTIILLFLTMTLLADEKLLTVNDLQKAVTSTRKKMEAVKDNEKKLKELQGLHKKFETTIKAYKDKYPQKGPKEELEILMFYYSLEHVFELQNEAITKESCEDKEHQIRLEDGRTSDGKVSKYAQQALDILKLLCPK